MADVQQTYKFKFEFDRKDIKKQLNGIAGDVQEAIARMGDASDKVVIFKDLVKYLSNVDKALDVFKSKHKNDFDDLFGNPDASILSVLEDIFGATEKSAQAFVDLKNRIAEAAMKNSDLRVWKNIAKDINELYASVGKEMPIDIDGMKSAKGAVKMLGDTLDQFGETYAAFQDKLRGGFGGGSGGFGGGIKMLTDAAKKEIDELEQQINQYNKSIQKLNKINSMNKAFADGDMIEVDFDATENAMKNLIERYNKLREESERLETSSKEYAENLAETVEVALKLNAINEELVTKGKSPKFLTDFLKGNDEDIEDVLWEFDGTFKSILKQFEKGLSDAKNKISEIKADANSYVKGDGASYGTPMSDATKDADKAGYAVNEFNKKIKDAETYVKALSGHLEKMFKVASRGTDLEYHIAIDGLDIKANRGLEKQIDMTTQTGTYLDTLFAESAIYGHSHRGGTHIANIADIEGVLKAYMDGVAIPLHFVVGKDAVSTIDFTGISEDIVEQLIQEIAATNEKGLKTAPAQYDIINKITEKLTGKTGALKSWNANQFDDLAKYLYEVSSAATSVLTPMEKFQAILDHMFEKGKVDASKYESLLAGLNKDNAKSLFNRIASKEGLQPIDTKDMLTMSQVNSEIDESIRKYQTLRNEANKSYSEIRAEVDKVLEHWKSGGSAGSGLDFFKKYFPENEWQNVQSMLIEAHNNLKSVEEVTNRFANEFGIDPEMWDAIPTGQGSVANEEKLKGRLDTLKIIAEIDKDIAQTYDHQVDELDELIRQRKAVLADAELANNLDEETLQIQKEINQKLEERSRLIHESYDNAYADFNKEFGDLSNIDFSKLSLDEIDQCINRLSVLYSKLQEADGNYLIGDFDKIEEQYNEAMTTLQRSRARLIVGTGSGQSIDDDELDIIVKENGALEDKLELLQEIADQYGVNIDQRKRNSYEKLVDKDNEEGLTERDADRFAELGETIDEADSNLMEFEERYDRIVLKLSNGKKLEILPNDKGLRDLYHISDNGGTYQGHEIEDIQFVRHQQVGHAVEAGQAIEEANKKLDTFLALSKEISDKSFYQMGDATDNVEIGKYTEKLTAAKNELEELGKQGLLTAEQIGYANDAFNVASEHLRDSTKTYDDYYSSHGYDYSYYSEYREQRDRADAAEAEAERLSEELNNKKLETPNGQRKLFEDIADDSIKAGNAISELNDELRETRELDGQISIDDYMTAKDAETAQKVKDESKAVSQEAETLEELRKKLIEVKEAVSTKTKAFYDEGTVVGQVVGKEVAALTKLLEIVDKIAPKVEAMATNMAAIGPIDLVQQTVGTGTDDTNITPQNAFKSRVDHKKGAMTSYIEGLKGVQYVADETRQELIYLREMMDSVKTPDGLNAIVTKFEELQKEIGLAKKNFEDINLNKVNKEKSKLFGVYNGLTRDQQKDLEPELEQAIAQLNRYEADIKEGKKIELDAIEAVTHALRQKLETYQQVNKEAKKQTSGIKADNSKFGETISINAAAKYNRLSKIATDQFSNSREVSAVLAEYTKYYEKMNNLRDTLRSKNKNDITSEDRESFKAARDECNEYAKALEKLINNSLKLHGEKANKEDYMLGADFNYSNTDMRKAALTDFVKEMYNVNVATTDFKDNWSKVVFAVDNGDGTFTQMTATFTDARNEIVAMAGDTKEVQSALSNFISGFKGRVKSLTQYFLATISIYDAIRVLRQGVQYVKEIDSALTELKKVTDETDATYRRFLQTASQTGAKIGATVADLVNATADFARLGYNIEEAASLAEAASVYKNVGDGIDDITTASESIISTMKAFGIEADNAMGIVDRFNEIGNNFAISSTGIGEAMQRSASALFEAGNTIDESIALITGANSVVQNPEQVGELIAHQHSNMLLVNSYIG